MRFQRVVFAVLKSDKMPERTTALEGGVTILITFRKNY